jgi:hypothetical protein
VPIEVRIEVEALAPARRAAGGQARCRDRDLAGPRSAPAASALFRDEILVIVPHDHPFAARRSCPSDLADRRC